MKSRAVTILSRAREGQDNRRTWALWLQLKAFALTMPEAGQSHLRRQEGETSSQAPHRAAGCVLRERIYRME